MLITISAASNPQDRVASRVASPKLVKASVRKNGTGRKAWEYLFTEHQMDGHSQQRHQWRLQTVAEIASNSPAAPPFLRPCVLSRAKVR
jgi:hypothetical protein